MTVVSDPQTAWVHFLDFIQSRCSKAEFQNWIEPIRFLSGTASEIVLEVPNVFVQEYLVENFKEILKEFLPPVSFVQAEVQKAPSFSPPLKEEEDAVCEAKLNELYTFENYIEGTSNQFVKSAALGVALRPGKSYNPLFIHGGVGLGKTHLLHSIGHYVKHSHKKLRIHAITTEAFINDIVDHLRNKSIDQMKRYYRTLDVLLVDDIQFLQNRLNFEEEFCNTFEALIHQNKQIVITSDKPPSQLKLSERIIARMEWGLVAHVGTPDLETRVAIIKHKSEIRGMQISSELAFFIAEHIYNNVRQLEGAINRLLAHSKLTSEGLSQEVVQRILREMFQQAAPSKKISVEEILKGVATVFEVRLSEIKGESRQKEIILARQVAMYLAKELMDDSLVKIAASFGGKTHSTLLHAWKKIAAQLESNELLTRQVQMVRRSVSY